MPIVNSESPYVTYLFGFPVMSFKLRTILSWVIFHGLDFAALLVLTGIALSLWRRMLDRGAQAVQSSRWIFCRSFCCSRFPSRDWR